ncbi:MAG: AAA family ATPase [Blastocatellia bacterium]|jgi:adenylate kinase|nr:AAA family ATPase [Blastocatellia bacterium]
MNTKTEIEEGRVNNERQFHVIYLTGAPASGKSTLVELLEGNFQPMKTFVYSRVLADYLREKSVRQYSQDHLREKSAQLITPDDIEIVDTRLLDFVTENAKKAHIVIDSHAVTKETYGFRVTPFSLEQLRKLSPTLIFVLYTAPSVILNRIKNNSQGRPTVSEFEAGFHSELQATVALIYGIQIGIPVYFLDSDRPSDDLVSEVVKRIERAAGK